MTPPPAITPADTQMMHKALDLARHAATLGEVPVGAVVYRTLDDGTPQVLGEGYNRREIDHDPAAHAELIAIRAAAHTLADWRLERCTLAVTLEPCPMCAGLIVNARVARVIYGADDPKAGACRSLFALTTDARLNHRVELVPGVLADECAAQLKDFFRALRHR